MKLIQKLTQRAVPILAGLLVVVASFWFEMTDNATASTIRERMNSIVYDIRMQISVLTKKPLVSSSVDVVIVDIDEKSLKAEGRWPWPRDKVTDLLEKLRDGGASVIAFDIVFAEAQRNIADEMLQDLTADKINNPNLMSNIKGVEQLFDYDEVFAKKLAEKNDVALGFILSADPNDKIGTLPAPLMTLTPDQIPYVQINSLPGQIANLPVLQEGAKNGGFVTTLTDYDGIIRRAPLVMVHDGKVYPSLALAAVMEYYFLNTVDVHLYKEKDIIAMTDLGLGKTLIPTDSYGQVLIPYKGNSGTFPSISASDILQGKSDPKIMDSKIVFIGASALGLGDLHATPFETSFPGVEIHATIADSLLKGSFPTVPDWALGAKLFVIGVLGLILALALPHFSVLWVILIPLFLSIAVGSGSIWLYTAKNIYLSTVTIYLMAIGIILVNVVYGFMFESRKRKALKEMFGQYVPPAHVERMSESKIQYTFEGESREMSVLFADIRSFTSISEKLTPTQLKKLLNDYFTPMTKVIFDNNGTIDKYVGDMIMAFWGAPLENPNHFLDAVKGGLQMQKTADAMAGQFADMGVNAIHIGVGINSGFMNVGDMGSKFRRSYTVLGDAVNLASRLESSTKFYHTNMIISEATLLGCKGEVIARHLDRVKVVGKAEAIEIYTPLCMKNEITPEITKELEMLALAEDHYYKAEWDEALAMYEKLKAAYPEVGLYELYIERIKGLKEKGVTAPWDGCFVRESK